MMRQVRPKKDVMSHSFSIEKNNKKTCIKTSIKRTVIAEENTFNCINFKGVILDDR